MTLWLRFIFKFCASGVSKTEKEAKKTQWAKWLKRKPFKFYCCRCCLASKSDKLSLLHLMNCELKVRAAECHCVYLCTANLESNQASHSWELSLQLFRLMTQIELEKSLAQSGMIYLRASWKRGRKKSRALQRAGCARNWQTEAE